MVDVLTHEDELRLVRLAREVAMDMQPLESVLGRLGFTLAQYHQLARWPRFQALLASAVAEWEGALNTHERVKLKAAAMMEDWLPEAHRRLHDRTEALPAKVETAKLVAKLAGMGAERELPGGTGAEGRFSLVINIGKLSPVTISGPGDERQRGEAPELDLPALPVRRSA